MKSKENAFSGGSSGEETGTRVQQEKETKQSTEMRL